jgi:hypothetical protein
MIRYVSLCVCRILPGYAGWWSGLPAAGLPTTAKVAAQCGRSPGAIATERGWLEMAGDGMGVVRMAGGL